MKVYYIIQLNYQLTGNTENLKIKLYHFQERLSLRYNIQHNPDVNVSVSYMFLAK